VAAMQLRSGGASARDYIGQSQERPEDQALLARTDAPLEKSRGPNSDSTAC
jgi:hypothetical protein